MATLVLLGDSVIDNAAYVRQGAPAVSTQVRAGLPDWTVEMRAVDGYRCADVSSSLASTPSSKADAVFLSVGGNDALDHLSLLSGGPAMTFAEAMTTMREIREKFRARYAPLLAAIGAAPLLVATIYNPAFHAETPELQAPAEGALSAFNDVIQQEALAAGASLLDLRRLFDAAEDYANPIEPSAVGGEKIAQAVATWARA